jgi:dUTP pyrophosphatase
LCCDGAKLPAYATNGSAAMDIYSPEEYTIGPGESIMIPTGLKVNIPIGYALLIQPRSGMSRKTKLRICNTPGLIDSDYHEEIGVLVENIDAPLKDFSIQQDGEAILQGPLYGSSFTIGKGERFAQMRLVEVPMVNWLPVSSIGSFENDHGAGFGGTGNK